MLGSRFVRLRTLGLEFSSGKLWYVIPGEVDEYWYVVMINYLFLLKLLVNRQRNMWTKKDCQIGMKKIDLFNLRL